jgi:hypothetical protein
MKPMLKKITLLLIFLWCGFMQDKLHNITAINLSIEEAQSKLIEILKTENKNKPPNKIEDKGNVFMIRQYPPQ